MRALLTFFASLALSIVVSTALAFADEAYFERENLNSGLPEAPAHVDRSTPRQTIETLYDLADQGHWVDAAHLLDLSDLPPEQQLEAGPELARKLSTVINRKVVVNWSQLIDRPDGLDATETSNAATAGMERRSLRLWELNAGKVPTSIRLERIKPGAEDPVWVFSRRTVEDIDKLYAAYGPSEFESALPQALKQEFIWGLMGWEFIGLPLLVFLAASAGWLTSKAVTWARRRATSTLWSRVLNATSKPLVIAAVTSVIWWGVSTVFVFSGRLDAFISPLIAIGFVSAALLFVLNVFEAALDRLVGFDNFDLTSRQEAAKRTAATRVAAVRRVLALIVFVVGVGIVLSMANVFRSIGFSLLASAGALTLVLGFAARRVLGNILASLQIALNQSARIGDRVVFKDHLCHVERINFTYVQLRDWTGLRLVVPVEEFISETFENWTLKEPEMLRILKFKLSPEVDMQALRDAFDEVIASLDPEEMDDTDKANVVVAGQDIFGIDVWFYVPCCDPNTSWDLACQAREKMVKKLTELDQRSDWKVFPDTPPAEAA